MFRDTPQAFATDWEALSLAKQAINNGYDRQLLAVQRWFIYLPFEHSENPDDQRKCIKLFQQLSHDPDSAEAIASAFRHKEIIARFGRFPHRNAILGRISTPEEEEFLEEPGSSF
jgi:DNA phosphorothioation-dependent restriction protein DptG